jgi:hypothetical protein
MTKTFLIANQNFRESFQDHPAVVQLFRDVLISGWESMKSVILILGALFEN